jgi:hypothetical protein
MRRVLLHRAITVVVGAFCGTVVPLGAAVYTVGPGQAHETPLTVPWESLEPGDRVDIHWRAEPYKAKWVICRQGTADQPITVRGISSPEGVKPVIDGVDALTAPALNYTGGNRSVVKIGAANIPADTLPKHIVIENLELRGARPPYQFTDRGGVVRPYLNHAAPLWIEKGESIVVRNCTLTDGGNGFMVSSTDAVPSRTILVEGCWIHSNGNEGRILEHNIYTAAIGMVFQNNRLGPLRPGTGGNNLKDRSAGLVVRYNWIEGGNRQLDLVHGEDSSAIRAAPEYRAAHVYGNVLLEHADDGNRQLIHYGGDNPAVESQYRKGTLHLFHNTIISRRTDLTALIRLSTNDESCDARNNIFYTPSAGSTFRLLETSGNLVLARNWIKTGWQEMTPTPHNGTVTGTATFITGSSPLFADEPGDRFDLRPGSPAADQAVAPHAGTAGHPVDREYVLHGRSRARVANGIADLGAFELGRFDAWRWERFGEGALDPAIAGDWADPDRDGAANVLEFALGTDPVHGGSIPAADCVPAAGPGGSHPAIRFRRAASPTGLYYQVWWGLSAPPDQRGHRFTDGAATPGTGVTADLGMSEGMQTVRSLIPIGDAPRQFFALEVGPES